ncbi:hypothetical protein PIB30_037711 [Stylosanthes scabra]|uniref:Uncharacterized protein n=1 Tax=Stylosanthes scabra TaxID=79078 RepID=A0ABU6ZB90_9FABA|nr:hypothetical protein [Stylosanthes scabra]
MATNVQRKPNLSLGTQMVLIKLQEHLTLCQRKEETGTANKEASQVVLEEAKGDLKKEEEDTGKVTNYVRRMTSHKELSNANHVTKRKSEAKKEETALKRRRSRLLLHLLFIPMKVQGYIQHGICPSRQGG